MGNTCDRGALEPQYQQRSPLHSGQEVIESIPQFPYLSDGDEDRAENKSDKLKGDSLVLSWSLSWDRGLGRTMLSHCGREEGRELHRGGSGGRPAAVHGCRLRSLPSPSSCLGVL